MNMTRADQIERMQRYKVSRGRTCSFQLLDPNDRWTKHRTRLVDISMTGAAVESDQPVKTGIVWFRDSLCGYKCGILVWCNRRGVRYQAGIQFVGLSQQDTAYLKRQMEQKKPGHPQEGQTGLNPVVERILKNRA